MGKATRRKVRERLGEGPFSHALFQNNPLPMWFYDLETLAILNVNEVACRKYGYSREEFLSLSIRDIRPECDIPLLEESVRTAPPVELSAGIWKHRMRDGTLIDVEITSHEMHYKGRRARFVCPIDVTQRLRAEKALREREAGLRRAQAMARLGHVITRADGSFESWSETLPGLAGVPVADMPRSVQDWLGRLVHPEDRDLFRRKSSEAAMTGTRIDVEYRMPRADGGVTFMRQAIEPIDGGSPADGLRWFSTLQDVSELKHAERRVMLANEELEARVLERTAQLQTSNHELALAKAAADRASRTKSEFLSNISHELRTPLNAIVGFGQLLASSDQRLREPDRQAAFVKHIVSAGQHLLMLINELLDLAHVESGTLTMAIESVSLGEVLRDCMGMIEPLASSRQIRIEADSHQSTRVMADRVRLKQVLLNLLSNAVKYNRDGGLVRVEWVQQPAGHVRISVSDTGQGLLPTQIDMLFQAFNRLGQAASGSEGSGLGLVVTKRLVELMGGRIGVTSTVGVGSVFWVDLNCEASATVANVATAPPTPDL